MKNVLVVSHRRSGTHLTIDAIRNNFHVFSNGGEVADLTLDNYTERKNKGDFSKLRQLALKVSDKSCVYKAHTNVNVELYFGRSFDVEDGFIKKLFDSSKIIYVYRDGRDVMTSLYHYQKQFSETVKQQSFSEFLRGINTTDRYSYNDELSRVGYWAHHVSNWLERREILPLCFDDIKVNFRESLSRISSYIDVEPNSNIIDVTMEKSEQGIVRDKSALRSSVSFRKGISGDWKNEFTSDDLDYFYSEVSKVSPTLFNTLYSKCI